MWVCTKEAHKGLYLDSIENEPDIVETLSLGDDAHFGPEDVA